MSFFGLELSPGKTYKQTVDMPFRLSMVALGFGPVKKERSTLTISTDGEDGEFALCSLTPGALEQQPVDIVFEAGEEVRLHVHGANKMYLTGNYADEESMMDMDPYSEDEEILSEEEELDEDAVDLKAMNAIKGKSKRTARESESSEDEDEMGEEDSELDDELLDDELLDDDESTEEDDEDDEEVDEEEMEAIFKQLFAERLANGESVEDIDAELQAMMEEAEDDDDEAEDEEEEELTPRITEVTEVVTKPNGTQVTKTDKKAELAPKASQKAAPKTTPAAKGAAAAEPKKQETNAAKSEKKRAHEDAAPVEEASKKAKIETRTLPSGVQITDTKIGNGTRAKNGKRISMHYVGKLTSNNKQFDATKGKPFDFGLGKGEVIKGFDLGVQGMQVGGERRVVIPANLAYGKKALPGIPANSSLTFDIKLVNVK